MDSEKVYFDVRAAVAKIASPDLTMVPSKPPPQGLGASRVGAWGEKLSRIVADLNKKGYLTLKLAKSDAKNTYELTLQATVLLLHRRIMGVERVSVKLIEIEADLLNSLQKRAAAASRRGGK